MAAAVIDTASQLLIVQLIEEDIQLLRHASEAEALQLEQAIEVSAPQDDQKAKRKRVKLPEDAVLDIYAKEVKIAVDACIAESLEQASRGAIFADQLLAQKLAAEERKLALDSALCQRLKELDNRGENIDSYTDVESILSTDVINAILNLNSDDEKKRKRSSIDKGKGKAITAREDPPEDSDEVRFSDSKSPYAKCGICLEPFQPTHAPATAVLTANSSDRVPFGLSLPCPKEHGYCISCLTNYIQLKLDPDGTGKQNPDVLVFPILCPECPITEWPLGIDDSVAERVLDTSTMAVWHHRRLLDTIPRLYCPNPGCSELVEISNDPDETQVTCPYCSKAMCVQCRVEWHENFTCEQFQDLPPEERSREDLLLLELARVKNWRRCPRCAVVVELTHGCHHITCRCTFQFCFRCGSGWDVHKNKCTQMPSCDLWDEDMLLEHRAQERRPAVPVVPAVPVNDRPQVYRPPEIAYVRPRPFAWMDDPAVVCPRHWFTINMIRGLRCGYCDAFLNSLVALQRHLADVRKHPVYACCGKFFKRELDYNHHVESAKYVHDYQYRSD